MSPQDEAYTWNPNTDYARCFLHKLSSTVKGGLEELVFPFSATLPVIAEEDEDKSSTSTPILIDLEDDHPAPDKVDTDHDSEGEEDLEVPPDFNAEDDINEDQVESLAKTLPDNSVASKYHTTASRKQANRMNGLTSKANFISCRVARSAAWRRHFARIAKGMNLKVLPLTPGYNATRCNAEFDSLNRLVQAKK
ncbi:uncharacterized protein MELLADRAFT_68341 [Melampsora larici-populina 98AG31]|uniref:Uncharacterized protein n=1 Tax=Melampsora larici-populina (strain 98AG31 / pathotype 3-4-7) TaxID=747676 RepID=F4S6F8_MELLP|nr:uncharacterized protein MELLADRAFT_68341 [Melampsora larici-populina 98AG31]EGF99799.1 hypothetical protein MELLADRAFT_68341 [Melampsora larici-populina 98AG31]